MKKYWFAQVDVSEANALEAYKKSRFVRFLIAQVAATQQLNKDKFRLVPLQNFNSNSPIDWTKDINEIDEQLFAYYGLSDSEQDFRKSKIKEM